MSRAPELPPPPSPGEPGSPEPGSPEPGSPEPGSPESPPLPEELRELLPELSRPDLGAFLVRALGNWAEIGLLFWILDRAWSLPLAALGLVLLGTRQHALAMLAHDGAHRAASRDPRVNDALTCVLLFWPLYGGLDGYRRFHFAHHRRTGGPGDPELRYKADFPESWTLPCPPGRLGHLLVRDLLGLHAGQLVRLGAHIPPASTRDRIGSPLWFLAVALVLGPLGKLWMIVYWWVSFMTCHWALFRLRAWTEHVGTAGTHRIHAGPLARAVFLQHHTWYHWEHHRCPSVPSWNLPRVRALLPDPPVRTLAELFRTHATAVPVTPPGVSPGPAS